MNAGIESVGLWSYCVSKERLVGCYVEKESVEEVPLETRRHLVLASRTLQ